MWPNSKHTTKKPAAQDCTSCDFGLRGPVYQKHFRPESCTKPLSWHASCLSPANRYTRYIHTTECRRGVRGGGLTPALAPRKPLRSEDRYCRGCTTFSFTSRCFLRRSCLLVSVIDLFRKNCVWLSFRVFDLCPGFVRISLFFVVVFCFGK